MTGTMAIKFQHEFQKEQAVSRPQQTEMSSGGEGTNCGCLVLSSYSEVKMSVPGNTILDLKKNHSKFSSDRVTVTSLT